MLIHCNSLITLILPLQSFTHPEALKFAEGIKDQVSIGDILVSYNGKSFKELYEENKHFTGGANEYGGMRSILNIMSFRPGSMYPLPEENEVTYVLKKGLHSRETYTITAPIVGISHDACVFIDMLGLNDMDEDGEDDQTEEGFERKRAESSGIFNSIYRGPYHAKDHTVDTEFNARMDVDEPMTATGAVTHDIEMSASDDDTMSIDSDSDMDVDATAEEAARQRKRVKLAKRHLNEGGVNKHPYLDELKFQYNPNDDYEMKETDEPIISWSIYERRPTKMGIIRLESFMPEADQSGMMSLEIIRSLLTNELADTDALIFDIRDNGGGLIVMADLIPQFFTPNLDTSAARALVAPVNKQIFMDKMPNSR